MWINPKRFRRLEEELVSTTQTLAMVQNEQQEEIAQLQRVASLQGEVVVSSHQSIKELNNFADEQEAIVASLLERVWDLEDDEEFPWDNDDDEDMGVSFDEVFQDGFEQGLEKGRAEKKTKKKTK